MHPDPDDTELMHSHYACKIPAWCAATRIGRAYSRRRITRMIRAELAEKGYEPAGRLCFHFGMIDGSATVLAHFTTRDALAVAFSAEGER